MYLTETSIINLHQVEGYTQGRTSGKSNSVMISKWIFVCLVILELNLLGGFAHEDNINFPIAATNPATMSNHNGLGFYKVDLDPNQDSSNKFVILNQQVDHVDSSKVTTVKESSKAVDQSSNKTDSRVSDEGGDMTVIIGTMVANALIFVVGFFGNAIVILVILKFTRTETVTDIYILNLAMADLMFTAGLVFLITTMLVGHWIFGNITCKLYMATTSLNQFASSLLLVVMSFDRFLAVCHPIYAQQFRQTKQAKIICLCIWIICLILMSPIFAFAKINEELTCAIFWPEYKSFSCEVAFTLYSFAIGFALPLILIAIFYSCVIRKLRLAASGVTSLGSSRRSKSRETTNKRIEHLVIGIICTYTICWLPYWITQLFVSFSTGENSPVMGFYEIFLVGTSLSYANSALNPILYAFLSDNFKRRCSDIFHTVCSTILRASGCSCSHATTTTTTCPESEISRIDSRPLVNMTESSHIISNQSSQSRRDQNGSRLDMSNRIHRPANDTQCDLSIVRAKKNCIVEDSGPKYCSEKNKSVVFGPGTVVVQALTELNCKNGPSNHLDGDVCQDV